MKKLNLLFTLLLLTFLQISIGLNTYSQTNDKFIQSKQAIPNRYIVVLNDDKGVINNFPNNVLIEDEKVRKVTRDLSLAYGGNIDRQYTRAIKGYAVNMSLQQALILSQDPRVKYVEEDFFVYKDQTQTGAPTGLDRIDQRILPLDTIYNYATNGTGVHAYVIDSGIRATHTEFIGRIGNGQDFVNDGQGTNDCDGHGTHVSGILGGTTYGVAKNVTIHPLRIFNCQGVSSGSGSIAAIDWITANRVPNAPGLVNMSLGGGYSTTSNNAVANSIAQTGLTYVVSAGNDNNDACDKSPASAPSAITVGSSRPTTDVRSSFSNYGVCVDVFAPGSSITSASHNSDTGTAVFSGTSMSAPNVSGIVARFLQMNPNATPAQVENSVINSATNGVIIDPGVGSPNRLVFADVVFNNTNPTPPTPGPAPAVRIPEQGVGTPYPAEYLVSGRPPIIGNEPDSIVVNINGFSHTATGEVSLLLEGPTGAKFLLQSGAGFNEDANNINYSITDVASSTMSNTTAIQAGTSYKPTAHNIINFPTPGPGNSYGNPGPVSGGVATMASTFGGTNPNGIWKLYVKDENLGDRGRIVNWSVYTQEPSLPSSPANLQATVVSDTQINLSWNANPPNQNVTSYNLSVNGGNWITGITSTSYSLTGLLPGRSYSIEVVAVNSYGGISSPSRINSTTTGTFIPGPPTNTSVTQLPFAFDTLIVSWTPPSGNIASYNVRVDGSRILTGFTAPFANVSGLNPNTTYSFEVQAVSNLGSTSTWSPPVTGRTPVTQPTGTAAFISSDTTTKGNWSGNYGSQGYVVVGETTNLPSWAQAAMTGGNAHTWAATTNDPRALQKGANPADRIAATWYTRTPFVANEQFDISVNLNDGQPHKVALYMMDWDNLNRNQVLEVIDKGTGAVLDTRTVNNFADGLYLNWRVSGQVIIRVKNATAASMNAIISGLFVDALTPTGSASFVSVDSTTKGGWVNNYGNQGYTIVGETSNLPSWMQSSMTGGNAHTWAATTNDSRALRKANNANERIAATWYTRTPFVANSQFDISVNLNDGQPHKVALYAMDWDRLNRNQSFEVIDKGTGIVLDTRTVNNFDEGLYLNWRVTGQVIIRVKNATAASMNAIVSGLFIDSPNPTPTGTASFVSYDSTTKGSWVSKYGGQGYSIVGETDNLPNSVYSFMTGGNTHTWANSTPDPRALQKGANPNDRIAATWYTRTPFVANEQFDISVNLTDGQPHKVALYMMDWDNQNRNQVLEVIDRGTGTVLDTRTVNNFADGLYLNWRVSGQVIIRVKNATAASMNAIISGLFIDSLTPTGSASFVSVDSTTKGGWVNNYGNQGYTIVGETSNLPSWMQSSMIGGNAHTWANTTNDRRALQKGANPNDRIAATWYTRTPFVANSQFDISLNLNDGQPHKIALYMMDWDNQNRTQTLEVIDKGTGTILDTRTVNNFAEGMYLNWRVSGQVVIRVKNTTAASMNAIVSGLFIDSLTPTGSASFVSVDSTTKGDWINNYGGQGYTIVGETNNLPNWLQLSTSGNNTHTWAASTADPRALRKGANPADRIAATWYTRTPFVANEQFDISLNLNDGQPHKVALYAMDWDHQNRNQIFEVIDKGTGTVLDTRNLNNFDEGVYLNWQVSGQIIIRVKNATAASMNALVSGIFIDN